MNEAELRAKALKLLSAREHSRAELQRKLTGHGESTDIQTLLDDLEARDWLSDARFAQAYVEANAKRFGRYRLEAELRERCVADSTIQAALAVLADSDDSGDELGRARAAWEKKFGQLPNDTADRAKQARFLQSRGFAYDVIRRVLGGLDDE